MRTTMCFTPAVLTSIACSRVWPPRSNPVSNSPFRAEMTCITNKNKIRYSNCLKANHKFSKTLRMREREKFKVFKNLQRCSINTRQTKNIVHYHLGVKERNSKLPELRDQPAKLRRSCLARSSCDPVRPRWWNVFSLSRNKLDQLRPSFLCLVLKNINKLSRSLQRKFKCNNQVELWIVILLDWCKCKREFIVNTQASTAQCVVVCLEISVKKLMRRKTGLLRTHKRHHLINYIKPTLVHRNMH